MSSIYSERVLESCVSCIAGLTTSTFCDLRAAGEHSDILHPYGLTLQQGCSIGWLTRSFASAAPGNPVAKTQAKPSKNLSGGRVPPAAEQVPREAAEQPGPSAHDSHSSSGTTALPRSTKDVGTSSATVGVDRPSAAAVPAGADQVPPSSTAQAASAQAIHHDDPKETDPQTPAPDQSMQSVLSDIGNLGQLNKGSSQTPAAPNANFGRWQRFKWWIWGTPQQYWTQSARSSSSDATHAAASTANTVGSSKKWRRSKWSIADIIASAILRSGITQDEDVAR